MNATIESPAPSILTDEKIIVVLKKSGPLTIEEMPSMPGMSWVQALSDVERLSRYGAVSLCRNRSSVLDGLQPDDSVSWSRAHEDFSCRSTDCGGIGFLLLDAVASLERHEPS